MAEKNSEGKAMTESNLKQLNEIYHQAAKLSHDLHELESEIFSAKIIGDGFDNIREELEKFPSLIYDGPFSDHIAEIKPRGLKGSTIEKDEASIKAKDSVDFIGKGKLEVSDGKSVSGKIPAYNFQLNNGKEGVYSIDISKKGGYLINMINSREVNDAKIMQSNAVNKARDYLFAQNYTNMEPTYSEVANKIAFISFAYKENGIIFYPDIINVQVALDNAQILAVEAVAYLVSHHKRDLPEIKLTEEDARSLVSSKLDRIEEIRLALIPQESLKEVLTYEVRGNKGEEVYLIYINAVSGEEEQILRVVKNKNATFAL